LIFDLLRIIARGVDNLRTNFGVSKTFRSRLIGQHLSDALRTLRPWPLTLEVAALVADAGLRAPSVYQVCRPSHSEDIGHLVCEH